MSDDTVLLALKRIYSKEEAVMELSRQVSKLKFLLGEKTSENSELKDKVSELKISLKIHEERNAKPKQAKVVEKEWNKDEYINQLKKQISTINKNNTRLSKDLNTWRDKCLSVLAKLQNRF